MTRWLLAIVPPEPLKEEIEALKKDISTRYQTTGALRSPAHITLHMPFDWKKEEEPFVQALTSFAHSVSSFPIELNGYGAFAPRVLFLHVMPSEALQTLHRNLSRWLKINFNILNSEYKNQPFHPHVTLAFRDLKKNQFELAWTAFHAQSFSKKFVCSSLQLLRHEQNQWKTQATFSFS